LHSLVSSSCVNLLEKEILFGTAFVSIGYELSALGIGKVVSELY
jgi:hypothetical protein